LPRQTSRRKVFYFVAYFARKKTLFSYFAAKTLFAQAWQCRFLSGHGTPSMLPVYIHVQDARLFAEMAPLGKSARTPQSVYYRGFLIKTNANIGSDKCFILYARGLNVAHQSLLVDGLASGGGGYKVVAINAFEKRGVIQLQRANCFVFQVYDFLAIDFHFIRGLALRKRGGARQNQDETA
jgi:hypothetical protein